MTAWISERIRKLPKQVREKFTAWLTIVEQEGPQGLAKYPGFNDEALRGDRTGYRSSRLNKQYRVIYTVDKNVITIFVVDVTTHDYRTK